MKITISEELKDRWPDTVLGILNYRAAVEKSGEDLLEYFDKKAEELAGAYHMEEIAQLPQIKYTREAYKALGKSPSECRNAAEAMLRRVVKGNGLYHINNVVECNNLISITSGYSIGSYDVSAVKGDVRLLWAPEGEHYKGIGKDSVNIGRLPVLYDGDGPFGNPTGDSRRAMITEGERDIVSIVYSFGGEDGLADTLEEYRKLLVKFHVAETDGISVYVIK